MPYRLLTFCIVIEFSISAFAQVRTYVANDQTTLGTEKELSASVRAADLDGDGDLDVVVANGRHWPGQNRVFFNRGQSLDDGKALFGEPVNLDAMRSNSYATEPVDLDGDGDLDIVVGNDRNPNRVFLNDGKGRYDDGTAFGEISSVRSLTVVDIDGDGDADVLATCRKRPNKIYRNDGAGHFDSGTSFGKPDSSTINVAATDWNRDGQVDLVLANRDNQRNAILIQGQGLRFDGRIEFGSDQEQTRAVAVADMNADGHADIIAANIGQPNRVFFSGADGDLASSISFGDENGRSYSMAVDDLDNDGDLDVVVGNVGQPNAVFFNQGNGADYVRCEFGAPSGATYGVDTGDFDGDGFVDVVVANSGGLNRVYLNQSVESPSNVDPKVGHDVRPKRTATDSAAAEHSERKNTQNWRAFRGDDATGVADGFRIPTKWNASEAAGNVAGVLWRKKVTGLSHSCPVVDGDRVYLTTAVAEDGQAPLKVGRGGQPTAADDNGEQSWKVLCYHRWTGDLLWETTARRGVPRVTRHAKATHANTTVCIDGTNVVAFFGSEGLYCYDLDGNLKWSKDLGVINISKYGIGWGFSSSPTIHQDRILIVCDDPDSPFVAALSLADGKEIWRRSRESICERSWGSPFVHVSNDRTQVVVNGWPWIVSYDFVSGEELWRIRGGGDNPVPTPFEAHGWIYITNAHGAESPIFVVRPEARGDVTPPEDTGSNEHVVWSTRRGGCYMSTPVVYGDHLYLGNTSGVLRCFHARTGERVYEKRLGRGASIIASLVAGDGKIYCVSEDGKVYVVRAGPEFEILSTNDMGAPCFATPAIADGVIYIRTIDELIAIE